MPRFDYEFTQIGDLGVQTELDKGGKPYVTHVVLNDEPIHPTPRFWTSLFSKFGITSSIFKYYDHEEVFARIAEREPKDRLRVCVERNEGGPSRLLAASNPERPIVAYNELHGLLTQFGGDDIRYEQGVVTSLHVPRGQVTSEIMGDVHSGRFMMATPIDGYGLPNLYIALLREVCVNGVIAMTKAFKSNLQLGKGGDDVRHSLTRALDGFSNEEGYAGLVSRLESAATSWASIAEAQSLYTMLIKLHSSMEVTNQAQPIPRGVISRQLGIRSDYLESKEAVDETINSPAIKAFHRLTGDTAHLYGMANIDALSLKRQRTLPVKCTVYELIVLATEIATHHATPNGQRVISAWVGELVGSGNEYDLEGTRQVFGEFDDFLVTQKSNAARELAAVS